MQQCEIKADLQNLHIVAATEVEVQAGGGKKAIIIFVPYKLLAQYHKIQSRLVREVRPPAPVSRTRLGDGACT